MRMLYLVGNLQVWKERDVPGPFDGTKEKSGGQLTDILDAHQIAARLTSRCRYQRSAAGRALSTGRATSEASSGHRRRVGLRAQQHGHETRQIATAGTTVTRPQRHGPARSGVTTAGRRATQPTRHHASWTARTTTAEVMVISRTVEHLSVTEAGMM